MAGNIKGITIELQGNIPPLEQALKKANAVAKSTANHSKTNVTYKTNWKYKGKINHFKKRSGRSWRTI